MPIYLKTEDFNELMKPDWESIKRRDKFIEEEDKIHPYCYDGEDIVMEIEDIDLGENYI